MTILSGPLGAGKTAVSKELVVLWPAPLAYIEGDQFWPFLVKRAEGDRREDFRVIMRAMTSAAGSLARTGYDVLLDFSVPPPFVPARLSWRAPTERGSLLALPDPPLQRFVQRVAGDEVRSAPRSAP